MLKLLENTEGGVISALIFRASVSFQKSEILLSAIATPSVFHLIFQ
jgi:hypothetical protein